ncbi:MAG: ParA family protein [Anaerolineae bacterium]|nr:ParA family protein [Anaerolineae bacterium]
MPAGRIVAVANQKGGVGKTTTAVNLSAAMARLGLSALLLDFDPQANATSSVGVDPRQVERNVYHLLSGRVTAREVILPTATSGLSLLPSGPDLAGAEVELVNLPGRESCLKEALEGVEREYDVTLIDCPPSLSLLTVNALVAASSGVLVPVQTEYLPLEGLSRLMETLEAVRLRFNRGMRVVGILMTMYDARTNLSAEVVQEVRRYFPGLVFREAIPRSVRLSEAPSRGVSVFGHAPSSAGALSYALVAEELLARLGVPAHRETQDA